MEPENHVGVDREIKRRNGKINMSFKICLVGCGGVVVEGHGPMLQKYAEMHDTVELAACCDVSMERAQEISAAFGFKQAFSDMNKMIHAIGPDAIVLAVPERVTAMLSIEILSRAIPLLLEKPPGISMEEGRAIVEAAHASGVPASVAFNRRTMPIVERLIRELEEADKGKILSIHIEMCRMNRTEPDFSMTAIHDIDLARFLCRSNYTDASFVYREYPSVAPAADIFLTAQTESRAVITMDIVPMCGIITERVQVRMHEHLFIAELPIFGSPDVPGRIIHFKDNDVANVINFGKDIAPAEANGFLGEYSSFFGALMDGRVPEHAVDDCMQSLEIACCMRKRMRVYGNSFN